MKSPQRYLSLACAVALGSLQNLQGSTVSNSNDSGPGSLRNAIASAFNGETINFNSTLSGATIMLTSDHLLINNLALIIDATTLSAGISISGNNLSRIFLITGTSAATLRNLTLRDGKALNGNGGAVFLAGGNIEMVGCTVSNCFATYNGGGIYLSLGTTSTLDRCRVTGNTASNAGFAGGIYIGGAASTSLRNCLVAGNSNPYGGGIYTANASPVFTNCTIQGNMGEGLRNESNADPVITNCIIWGNTSTGNTAEQQLRNSNGSNPNISYSLVQGASGPASFGDGNSTVWGAGNLNGELPGSDPKFASPLAASAAPHSGGDLRLLAASPVLNLGNNAAVTGTLDLAGSQRIRSGTVDMGAFEGGYVTFASLYPALSPSGDQNGNGISNFQEYGMGFDPSATNPTAAPGISKVGSATLLTVNQRANALDLAQLVETNAALSGPWTPLTQNVHYSIVTTTALTPERDVLVFQLLQTDPRRFYRQKFSGAN